MDNEMTFHCQLPAFNAGGASAPAEPPKPENGTPLGASEYGAGPFYRPHPQAEANRPKPDTFAANEFTVYGPNHVSGAGMPAGVYTSGPIYGQGSSAGISGMQGAMPPAPPNAYANGCHNAVWRKL